MSGELAVPIDLECVGTSKHLLLNRPDKRNALSEDIVEALLKLVVESYTDGTRLLTLRGTGKNFSSGFDFTGFEDTTDGDLLRRFVRIEQLLQNIAHAPFDTLAYAHGRNFGAGVDLFATCRRRLAAPETSFSMPGLGFGLVLGTRRFSDIVGSDWAHRVLYDGIAFDAQMAAERGFVTNVVPPEALNDWIESTSQSSLSSDATSRLLRVLRRDTRAADMAELVASAAVPDLKNRIRAYRDTGSKKPRISRSTDEI